MKKDKFFLSVAALLSFNATAFAQFTSGSDYIIQNVATEYYLGGGNSWGTQASLLPKAQRFAFIGENGVYSLDSHQFNDANSHFLTTGLYVDGGETPWTFTETADGSGIYTISNNGNYLVGKTKDAAIGTGTNASDANAMWKVISIADILASASTATVENPVDLSALIFDPDFKRNGNTVHFPTWTITSADGTQNCGNYGSVQNNLNRYCAESYHSSNGFKMSQTIGGVPAGVYRIDAQAFYRQDGTDTENMPYIFANDEKSLFPVRNGSENNMESAHASFLNKVYSIEPIYISLSEGESITIGAYNANTTMWNIWGDFEIHYYGDVSIAEVKNSGYVADFRTALKAAQEVDQTAKMSDDALAALQSALATYTEASVITDNATSESIVAATNALKKATNNANSSITAFASSASVIAKVDDLLNNTNFYTTDAYNTFVAAYNAFKATVDDGTATAVSVEEFRNSVFGSGWHAANTADDLLLSTWGTTEFNSNLYINTWSTEADNKENGSGMVVPFFEYWVSDANSLGATTKTGTIEGVKNGSYEVSALVRVRMKNGVTEGATGITMSVNGGAAVDVCAGSACDDGSQFLYGTFTASGEVTDGTLSVTFNVADGNNISWLSYKNVKWTLIKENETVKPTKIEVAAGKSALYLGETTTVTASFTPANATPNGTWSTSDAQVATVDKQGNVTAVGEGEATITFTSDIDQNVSGFAKVSVDYRSSLANGSFDEGTLATANVAGGSAGLAADIPGWTHSAAQAWLTASAIAYGDGAQINGGALPAADNTHNGGALGLSAGWGSGATYSQTIKLAAGTYKLSFDIYNTKPGTSSNSTLTVGFNGNDITGTTYGDEWKTYTTTFTLTEATVGDAYIKIAGANAGSGNQGKLVIDNVTLAPLSAEELAAIEAQILADAKTAKIAEIDKLSPVGDGLFQYSSAVINRVKATVNTATTVDAVNAVELPLVTAPAADKAFMLTSPQGNYLVVNNGVKLASEQKAIFFIQNNDGTFAISDGEVRVANGSNAWSLAANADGSAYTVAAVDGGITIKSDQGFFGMDNDADGATVFRNKAATTFAIADYVAPVNEIALNDDADYDPTVSSNGKTVTYTRNFTNTKWQALYLPFSFNVADQKGLSFATLSDINAYDEDEDGAIDKTLLEYLVQKTGTIFANTPVLVKADKVGEYSITADGELSDITSSTIQCQSTEKSFIVYGKTSAVSAENLNGKYALANGLLCLGDGRNGLKPYRWYLKVVTGNDLDLNRNETAAAVLAESKAKAAVSDEDKVFADHTDYTSVEATTYKSLTYTRNFSNTYWQTIYVPFSISAEDAAKAGLKLGKVSDVNLYDNDKDGEFDEMVLEVVAMPAGSRTIPGTPYFIKAAKAGQKTITLSDPTIYEYSQSLICYPFNTGASSWYEYEFHGTTQRYSGMYENGYLTVNGGVLCRFGEGATLSAQRWYMSYGDGMEYTSKANMRVNIIGDEDIDVTAIESLDLDDATDKDAIFTADGRLVSNDGKTAGLRPGLYIKGGKKFVVK